MPAEVNSKICEKLEENLPRASHANSKLVSPPSGLPVGPTVDLRAEWSRPDVTTERVVRLLLENDREFAKARGNGVIAKIENELISEGRAFLSKVFKIRLFFSPESNEVKEETVGSYSFVLKVAQHRNWKNYTDETMDGGPTSQREEPGERDEELLSVAASYHNIECEYYRLFKDGIPGCPIPAVHYIESIDAQHDGMLIMENLADCAEPLGYYRSATAGQLMAVARAAAHLHFHCDTPERREWWAPLFGHVFFDLFVDEFQPNGFPMLAGFEEIVSLLDRARELYDFAVAQMTGSMIILMAFVENRKSTIGLPPGTEDVFVRRITAATRRAAEIIERRGWQHYGRSVDWRAMMYKTKEEKSS
ncbi:hypothetical protein M3Y99_01077100 [Aphelenchoides fujianensis]|nr:hypothetical protein M3Y99_01077100 [Aphelenchoides fujianensis]